MVDRRTDGFPWNLVETAKEPVFQATLGPEVNVVRGAALGRPSDVIDRIELGRVRRKEVKFDLVPVVVHPFAHDACVVKADVV